MSASRSFIDEQPTAGAQPNVERPKPRSAETTARTASPRTLPKRPTTDLAEQRNRIACSPSDAVLILHASPGGKLERLADELLESSKPVWTLDDAADDGRDEVQGHFIGGPRMSRAASHTAHRSASAPGATPPRAAAGTIGDAPRATTIRCDSHAKLFVLDDSVPNPLELWKARSAARHERG